LKELREQNGYHYVISVDGGVNGDTIKLVKDAGADMVVSGSYVCKSEDYDKQIDTLR
jgi:ribulose-phosphate 3-epimerase